MRRARGDEHFAEAGALVKLDTPENENFIKKLLTSQQLALV
jgi:hypothetical protein